VLRIYFWLDGSKHSWLKVRSSVIRLIKRAFQDAGINMPDEERELIFPQGVPVRLMRDESAADDPPASPEKTGMAVGDHVLTAEPASSDAEGGLSSEATEIENQVRQSRKMEGENLLQSDGTHARVGQEPA
jgi:hypothetical protein